MNTRGSVLGIDVGWSKNKRSSAVCRLFWDAWEVKWQIQRFRAIDLDREDTIRHVVDNRMLLAVAIDGPLRPEFREVDRYRGAERLLNRGELPKRVGHPGPSSSSNGKDLNAQANKCATFLKKHCRIRKAKHKVRIDEYAIVEAFPTTFLGVMLDHPDYLKQPKSKKKSDIFFADLVSNRSLDQFLKKFLGNRKWSQNIDEINNHDDRAAFVCALTALCVSAGNFTAVGDERDGWIILPPQWAFAEWAWEAISETARQTAECHEDGELKVFSKNRLSSMSHR